MYEAADQFQESSLKKFYGKYPGVVLDNEPPADIQRGELTVKVHGILEEDQGGQGQGPIPIKVTAKPCYPPGFFFVPNVGDNVWIEFGAGDINTPVWTGVWYPKDKTPKTAKDKEPTRFQKVIRTVSGHVIQMDDSDGEENVAILHKSGSSVMIDNDNITITHRKKSEIKIDKDGNVTITDKGGNTTIKSEKITLESGNILLGDSGNGQPLALGDDLNEALDTIVNSILFHIHPTGMGPSGLLLPTPSVDLQTLLVKIKSKIILSKKSKTR